MARVWDLRALPQLMELLLDARVGKKKKGDDRSPSAVDAVGRPERKSVMPLCRACTVSMNTKEMENKNNNKVKEG